MSELTHFAACIQDVGRLAEGRDLVELTALIRDFKAVMLEAIEAEQGFPGRSIGDQITASWGGLPSQPPPQAALRACKAALRQLKGLAAHPRLAQLGLRVNIGIAYDDPGLCVELCRLCPALGAQVLVSAHTRELCAEALAFEALSSGQRRVFRLK